MATRIYAITPGESDVDVRENVGPAATSACINVIVDLNDAFNITDGDTTRSPDVNEVLEALENIKAHILRSNWPPA
jgi:hypothetical protein